MASNQQQINDGSNQDESSDDECYQARARPISHYLKQKQSAFNPEKQYTTTHDCDLRDEKECEQDNSNFHGSEDSIPKRPRYSEWTWNVALQDHDEVDYDEKVNMTNEDGSCKDTLALANQKTICLAPLRCSKERWPKTNKKKFNERIVSVLNAFRNSKYTKKTYKERSINLVITDSLMSSIPFEKIYQNTVKLFVGYPNDPFEIIEQIKKQIKNKENDYIIKNILLCIGFDSLVYYPNINQATKDTNKFLNQFLNVIKKAFAQNGPKRFKKVYRRLEELTEEIKEELMPIQPPKIIIVTIPEIRSHPTAFTYNLEIEKMNKAITKYVVSAKDFAFKTHNIVLELYDWAKFASTYPQCNTNDLRERNRILTVDLAEQFTWLMIPRSTENSTALKQDQAEAQVRRELMENNNIPQENNNNQKKRISYSEPLTSFASDESFDFEVEGPQVHELNNPQFATVQEDNFIAPRLRKRKGSSSNIHPFEKKSKRIFQRGRENTSSSDVIESDDGVSKEINSSLSILDPSKYELRHYDDGKIHIFVFPSKNKNTCYEFSISHPNYYRCLGCHEKKKYLGVNLRQNELTGEYSIFMKDDDLQHCCTPREYNPERFSKKFIQSSNFKFFHEKNSLKAVIFDDEKKFCYKLSYVPSNNGFSCYECLRIKKIRVTLKLHKNDEGQEYFSPGKNNHICEPLNYSEVIADKKFLSSHGLDVDKKKNSGREGRKPDPRFFDIQKNDKGNPQLIVYTSSEKLQWYIYFYDNSKKSFVCSRCCGVGNWVSAKYEKENSSNKHSCVSLGKNGHICKPFSTNTTD